MTDERKFCIVLAEAIAKSEKKRSEFYTELGIKKAYFYEIINDKVNPPPREKQLDIVRILKPDEATCIELFETAAKQRGEISMDIYFLIEKDSQIKNKLRSGSTYKKLMKNIKNGEMKNEK